MSTPPHPHHKDAFQVERLAFFSDAVFAIAITLMIIEVKPPHLEGDIGFGASLLELARTSGAHILAVLLSFTLIAIFWVRHHDLFRHVGRAPGKLLRLNFYFLLAVIFIPFSTAFVTESNTLSPLPLVFYNLIFILATWCNYRLYRHVLNEDNHLMDVPWEGDRQRLFRELLYPLFVFTLVGALAFVHPAIASMCYGLFSAEPLFTKRRKKAAPSPVRK